MRERGRAELVTGEARHALGGARGALEGDGPVKVRVEIIRGPHEDLTPIGMAMCRHCKRILGRQERGPGLVASAGARKMSG